MINKVKCDAEAFAYYFEWAMQYQCELRRQKVLNMLDDNPEMSRAYATDTETENNFVIITVAIRNAATFEMTIPRTKFDGFLFAEVIEKLVMQ